MSQTLEDIWAKMPKDRQVRVQKRVDQLLKELPSHLPTVGNAPDERGM